MADTHITADPGSPQIVITREFAAPLDLVFRAHVEPKLLVRWMGPRWYRTARPRNARFALHAAGIHGSRVAIASASS